MNQLSTGQNPARFPTRVWLLGVAVMVLVRLLGDLMPLTDARGWLWITRISEAWMVSGLLTLGLTAIPLKDAMRSVGLARSVAVGALVGMTLVGHLANVEFSTYPFVDWNMYTARVGEATFARLDLVFPDGSTQELPLRGSAQISREPRAVTGRLLELAEAAEGGDAAAAALLEDTVATLAQMVAPPSPQAIEVLRCTVTSPVPEAPTDCELVTNVPVEEE